MTLRVIKLGCAHSFIALMSISLSNKIISLFLVPPITQLWLPAKRESDVTRPWEEGTRAPSRAHQKRCGVPYREERSNRGAHVGWLRVRGQTDDEEGRQSQSPLLFPGYVRWGTLRRVWWLLEDLCREQHHFTQRKCPQLQVQPCPPHSWRRINSLWSLHPVSITFKLYCNFPPSCCIGFIISRPTDFLLLCARWVLRFFG